MEIVNKRPEELKPYEKNPRKNDRAVAPVAESIKQFGFKVPIIIDKNNVIISGHTRWKAAKRLKLTEVPCVVANDLTPEQIKAFRIADNKVAEIAEWDDKLLAEELEEVKDLLNWADLGINLDEVLVYNEPTEDEFDVEEELEKHPEPKAKHGDIYSLGNHRLMCGDSTKSEQVDLLMDGKNAHAVVTDPPYNVNYGNKADAINKYGYDFTHRRIMNDYMPEVQFIEFLTDAFENMERILRPGGSFYIFHASSTVLEFETALRSNNLKSRQQLIWVKNSIVLGRQDYQWKHEPCLYGWKDGHAHYFVDDRTKTTVFEDQPDLNTMTKEQMKKLLEEIYSDKLATSVIHVDKPSKSDEHPTMKPIKLMAPLIKNSTDQNQIVVDLFGGSGSTLIAAEQTNRTCYTMELDPKYVDVIIARWEKFTGKKATQIRKGDQE